MPKQTKGKKKKKVSKGRRKQVTLMSAKTPEVKRVQPKAMARSIPAAIQPQYPRTFAEIRAYNDAKNGVKNGVIIKYGGPLLICSSTAAAGTTVSIGNYNTVWSTGSIGTATAALDVNPWFLIPHGSTAEAAFGYARFVYKKLKFTWVGTISTTGIASVAIQYTPDGAAVASDYPAYADAAKSQCHMYTPCWSTMTIDCTPFLNTKDMYYIDWDTGATDAGLRQSYQGLATLKGSPTMLNYSSPYDWGLLYVEAELICAEPTPFLQDYAITARKPPRKERAPREPRCAVSEEPPSPPIVVERPLPTRRSESKSRS